MRIVNARVFRNGFFEQGGVEFKERILDAGPKVGADFSPVGGTDPSCDANAGGAPVPAGEDTIDAKGCYLIPGLVDIHTHAAVGEDASDGNADGLYKMADYYAAGGVTSWCPTTMTLKEPVLTRAMQAVKSYKRTENGARIAGVNLEGPFVSYAKRGAQNADNLHAPDADMFFRLNEASGGIVRLITIAPEEPGSMEFIKKVSGTATVSLGHTTADYDTAMAAYEAGARHATHLFNAMPALGHRAPGVIGAALDFGATVELITDGYHIHPSVVRLTHRLFGTKLTLISDSLRCAGMPDGEYELGGQPITLKGGVARLSGTDTLAGSSIHLMEGMKRAAAFGVPLEAAVTAATITPAAVIGMDKEIGSIATGKLADMVMLDKELNVRAVIIGGKMIK